MSYRTAPPRDNFGLRFGFRRCRSLAAADIHRSVGETHPALSRFGNDLLSHALRRSTIGATVLNGRVRDGIGCFTRAMITKPGKSWIRYTRLGFGVRLPEPSVFPFHSMPACRPPSPPRKKGRKPGLYWIEIKPFGQLVPVN